MNRGPFRELANDVLFPDEIEIAAFPSDESRFPICRMRFEIDNGQAVCTELAFIRIPGGPPASAAMVQAIAVGDLIEQAYTWQAVRTRQQVTMRLAVFGPDGYTVDEEGRISFWTEADAAKAGTDAISLRRQRSVTDDHLAKVAEIYLADTTGAPTEAVKIQLNTSRRNASRWVAQARERGLIPPYERKRRTDGVD